MTSRIKTNMLTILCKQANGMKENGEGGNKSWKSVKKRRRLARFVL